LVRHPVVLPFVLGWAMCGCGLVLGVDQIAGEVPYDGAATDTLPTTDGRAGDTSTPLDAGDAGDATPTDAAVDAAIPVCMPIVVDRVMLEPTGGPGHVDVLAVGDEAVVVYVDDDPTAHNQGQAAVDLGSFIQSSRGFRASTSTDGRNRVVKLGHTGGRVFVFTEVSAGLEAWSWRSASFSVPSVIASTTVFGVASSPSEVLLLISDTGGLRARSYDDRGRTTTSTIWPTFAGVTPAAAHDIDVAWHEERGEYLVVIAERPAFTGRGRVALFAADAAGALSGAPVDLLDTQPASAPAYSGSDGERNVWIAGAPGVAVVAYAVTDTTGDTGPSSDLAILRGTSPPEHLLSPLVVGRQMLTMSIGDGYAGVVYAVRNATGPSQVFVQPLGGGPPLPGPTLGSGNLSVASAPDPTGRGFALVAYKATAGGPVQLLRLGCL